MLWKKLNVNCLKGYVKWDFFEIGSLIHRGNWKVIWNLNYLNSWENVDKGSFQSI